MEKTILFNFPSSSEKKLTTILKQELTKWLKENHSTEKEKS